MIAVIILLADRSVKTVTATARMRAAIINAQLSFSGFYGIIIYIYGLEAMKENRGQANGNTN